MANNPPVDLDSIFEDEHDKLDKLEKSISKFIDYHKKYPDGLKQAYDEAPDKNAFYSELAEFIKGISELKFLVEVLQKSSEERTTPTSGTDETPVTKLIKEIDLISAYNVPGNAEPLYAQVNTELKFEDFFGEEEIKKLRRFIEDTAGVLLNNLYGRTSASDQDTFYMRFQKTQYLSFEPLYKKLGEFIEKNKTKFLSAQLILLIDLLKDPSKRTPKALKRLKTIIDEHSAPPRYVYEEKVVYNSSDDGENIYEEPVSVTEGEDGEPLYATPNPKPKIKFKKTREFPGFWGKKNEGDGGDY